MRFRVLIESIENDSCKARVTFESNDLGSSLGYAIAAIAPCTPRMDYAIADAIDECFQLTKYFESSLDDQFTKRTEALLEAAQAIKQGWEDYDEAQNKGTLAE